MSPVSLIGESILKSIARPTRSRPAETFDAYFLKQYDTSSTLLGRYPGLELRGKRVLEIGCGTGGRTAYIASIADSAVGIDINAEEIAVARSLCSSLKPEVAAKVEFLQSRENEPLDIGQFDVVLLIDSMEHVVSPPAILRLAYQYTKPGGVCYFGTFGWYHAKGSHTDLMPFANVFFSDETIVNVVRWRLSQPNYIPSRFDSDPPQDRWRGIYNLRDRPGEHLNKITVREMEKLVKYSMFKPARLHVLPYYRKGVIFSALGALRHLPVLRECFHSYVVGELHRPR